jgi:Sulfotransferase family
MVEAAFVVGIMPRSGTNFLHGLLTLHPGAVALDGIPEDRLLIPADHLDAYAARVARGWRDAWGVPDEEGRRLLSSIGDGLLAFLTASAGGRCVMTKTSSVQNIELFFDLFPAGRLILLVRDGRAVSESAARTFGWTRSFAMRRWAAAARAVLAFDAAHRSYERYRLVRYEDLLGDLEPTLRPLLELCELDPATYPWTEAHDQPLVGSSVFRGARQEIHWDPLRRPSDFRERVACSKGNSRWSRGPR